MEIPETVVEDIGTKTEKSLKIITKLSQERNSMKERRNGVVSEVFHRDVEGIDEAEDIYEVIPADFAPSSCFEKSSRSSSISSQGSTRTELTERNCNVSTVGIQTEGEDLSPNSSPKTTAHDAQEIETTEHYAEIFHAADLKLLEINRTRPTRESDNPILRQDFAQLTKHEQLLIPQLQIIRDSFAMTSQSKYLDNTVSNHETLPAHLLLKRSLSSGDNKNGYVMRTVDVLYENSPLQSPNHSPLPKHTSARTPVYENVKFPLDESDRESHCSISSSSTEGRSICSEEEITGNVESLYENVEDLSDGYRERTRSRPIDIVYSDLEFHGEEKLHPHVSSVESEKMTGRHTELYQKSKSLSLRRALKPSPPPRGSGLSRPKSLNLRRPTGGSLGLHLAKFVKKVTVQRSTDKILQATICEVLSKKHDDDDDAESSVNVEVNSDLVRISTNFPPWEVIASCDIETVGHVNLYEGDDTILGIIACPLGEESTCYIIRCPEATTIYESIKNAFRAPNLKQFTHIPSPDGQALHAFPVEESFTSIPHITYLGCVKVKKSYLVINDSIGALLDKLNPKDFKPITLKIRPEEILIVDESSQQKLHHHSISWVLSLGFFSEDPRLFGYIVTEARQGEKTRMFCHAFRCGRVTASVTATETIRIACQATFSPGRKDSIKSRRDSQRSLRSSISSDTSSLERRSSSSDPIDGPENKTKHHKETQSSPKHKTAAPVRLFRKLTPRKNSFTPPKSSFRSYTSEPNLSSLSSSGSFEEASTENTPETNEIIEEKEFNFRTAYLCSTVINPPLRPKHLRDSVKQYLKELKKMEKHTGTPPVIKEVELTLTCDGVTMSDPQCRHIGQRYFPFPSINNVRTHRDFPEYFAFSTVVSGDAKHKCHIFKRVKEPCEDITAAFECFLWEKV